MLTVAYLANRFPVAVEPYVGEEIRELQKWGVRVIAASVRRPDATTQRSAQDSSAPEILCLQPFRVLTLVRSLILVVKHWNRVADLVIRILIRGKESPQRRLKALLHTWLGAYYALLLQEHGVDHIHVHHGYFGSWIAMVAARLLDIGFSLTLHGSDLLIDAAYLDTKLKYCRFCTTISAYNRRYILEHFPTVDPGKIVVSRQGVDMPARVEFLQPLAARSTPRPLNLLAVGRLHAVKDHAFLIYVCAKLRDCGLDFECSIAGEGPERQRLDLLIQRLRLKPSVTLLGHVHQKQMNSLYRRADVVVLTSRSEGIPLVLMEAMARGRIVLAPSITGIPEIVIPGKTGFLYKPGVMADFVERILVLRELLRAEDRYAVSRLAWIRHAARVQVLHNFSRRQNLSQFCDAFLHLITNRDRAPEEWSPPNEDFVLQQV